MYTDKQIMVKLLLILPIHKACASNYFPNNAGKSALYVP